MSKKHITVIGNIIDHCPRKEGGISIGFYGEVRGWTGAVIAGNEIKNCSRRGIWVTGGENIVIKHNKIHRNGTGLEITQTKPCNIVGNDISGNKTNMKGGSSRAEEFPEARIVSPASNEFKKGRAVTFKSSGTAKGGKKIVSYWWFFGDDGTISKEQNPTHTFKKDGKYFVCLIVTDSAGLKDVALMPGRIEAVWNQKDTKRPWPGKKPRLATYPNPLYLTSINVKGAAKPVFVLYYYRGKPSLKIYDSKNKPVKEFKKFSMNAANLEKLGVDYYECLVEWDKKDISPGKYTAVASDDEGEIARCSFVVK